MSQFTRYCPTCNKLMAYSCKSALTRATRKNTNCKVCANLGENNPAYGKKFSEETRAKMSAKIISEETKKKMSLAQSHLKGKDHPNFGRYPSDDTRLKKSIAVTGEKNPNYGKHHSEETKHKIRLKRIASIKERYRQIIPNYNPKGCRIFDNLMIENNIFIQHAENGGEYYIKELGYWLDGYDTENNVVYEFDEGYHFLAGKLKEKDIIRQRKIEKFLNCSFIRIKEILFMLYDLKHIKRLNLK